jgi:polysaccharide biosynthesis protein PslE
VSRFLNPPRDEENPNAVSQRMTTEELAVLETFHSERFTASPGSRLLEALRHHKLLVAAVFLAVVGVTAAYIWHLPPKYQSEMTLFIARSRADVPVSAGNQPVGPVARDLDDAEVNSELELLKGTVLLAAAARQNGLLLNKEITSVEAAKVLESMQANLQVNLVHKSNIISVTFVDPDPSRAQAIVSTIGDLYLEEHGSIRRNPEAALFFAAKAKEYAAQLASAQRELELYERDLDLSAFDARTAQSLKRRSELQSQMDDTLSQLNEAQDKAAVLRRQLGALPPIVNSQNRSARNEPLVEQLKTMELELRQKRTELLSTYAPDYPPVQAVEQKIRDTHAALERELAPNVIDSVNAINPLHQQVQTELLQAESTIAALRAKQSNIGVNLQRENAAARVLVESAPRYDDLKRRVKVTEENYLLYTRKQEDSQIAEEMDRQRILNVSVLQPASNPVLPLDRHRSLIALLGMLAAMLLSVVAAVVTEGLDKPVWTHRDVFRAAGIPVIASIREADACS